MTRGCVIRDGGIGDEGVILSYRIPSNPLNIFFSFTVYTVEIYTLACTSTVVYHHDIPILLSYSSVPNWLLSILLVVIA